jgi:hypothetical protein
MADQLPAPKQVRDTLNDLLGRDVTVALEDPPAGESIPVVAVFVHENLSLAGVIGFERSAWSHPAGPRPRSRTAS